LNKELEQFSHAERVPGTSIVLVNRNDCEKDNYEMNTNSFICVDFNSDLDQQNEYELAYFTGILNYKPINKSDMIVIGQNKEEELVVAIVSLSRITDFYDSSYIEDVPQRIVKLESVE
jgi:hypothetical protein